MGADPPPNFMRSASLRVLGPLVSNAGAGGCGFAVPFGLLKAPDLPSGAFVGERPAPGGPCSLFRGDRDGRSRLDSQTLQTIYSRLPGDRVRFSWIVLGAPAVAGHQGRPKHARSPPWSDVRPCGI